VDFLRVPFPESTDDFEALSDVVAQHRHVRGTALFMRMAARSHFWTRSRSLTRAAQTFPWEPTRLSLYRTIVPQMTFWLPEEEGAQLRFDFETELARLEAA
jgi:hypothetical protein